MGGRGWSLRKARPKPRLPFNLSRRETDQARHSQSGPGAADSSLQASRRSTTSSLPHASAGLAARGWRECSLSSPTGCAAHRPGLPKTPAPATQAGPATPRQCPAHDGQAGSAHMVSWAVAVWHRQDASLEVRGHLARSPSASSSRATRQGTSGGWSKWPSLASTPLTLGGLQQRPAADLQEARPTTRPSNGSLCRRRTARDQAP
jgi:hypothetical protein